MSLSIASDIHTSDLTSACTHQVYLRHMNRYHPHAPTALFRGVMSGLVLEKIHASDYSEGKVGDLVELCYEETAKNLEEEGRERTESVIENKPVICEEVAAMAERYIARLMPLFEQCELIGTEVPCRLTLGDVNFASHMDLLVRDTSDVFGYGRGRILCIDWKFRKEAPTRAYLARNQQFTLYWLMIMHGSVMSFPAVDGWVEYNENCQMVWCHLPYLKPFGRKTVQKDDRDQEIEYKKGDERPVRSIMRDVNFRPDGVDIMSSDLTERVEMMRAGFFPKSPDPIRCQICESQDFCDRADIAL